MQRLKAACVAAVVFLGVLAGVQPAANARGVSCDAGFGTKVPVLMVHGLNSSPGTWSEGSPSMENAVRGVKNVRIVDAFDYKDHHSEWVTHPEIGPKLAKTIDCLAQASKKNGGRGKVVVVAHSMGGLATRFAANQTVNGRRVAEEIGLLVKLGTPDLGSGYGNLCQITAGADSRCSGSAPEALGEGSNELRELPQLPSSVPVFAIAGHVKVRFNLIFAPYERDMEGDKVVGVESATVRHTSLSGKFDKRVFACVGTSIWPEGDATCEHGEMLKAPYIQEAVVNRIREYLVESERAAARANLHSVTLFNDFKVRMLKRMTLHGYGGEGYSSYELECASGPCPKLSIYSPREAGDGNLGWQEWGWQDDCGVNEPVAKDDALVSRHQAHYYEAGPCRFWEMYDGRALFIAKDPPGTRQALLVDTMLASVTW